jgi:hypothetical protein
MSKISYCSLEEAWGLPNKNETPIKNNYDKLQEKSDNEMNTVIKNMNNIERSSIKENNIDTNNSIVQYRFNPYNKVSNNDLNDINISNNSSNLSNLSNLSNSSNLSNLNNKLTYSSLSDTPFNESIEKKYLKDKLQFLENELNKYKYLFDNPNKELIQNTNVIEKFDNQVAQPSNKPSDIIDLILLIIIGLIVILVMNSIFNLGKSIGYKRK